MAREVGIEPTMTVLETAALPLSYTPMRRSELSRFEWYCLEVSSLATPGPQPSVYPSTLRQHESPTGRLADYKPNIQNIPGSIADTLDKLFELGAL